MSEVSGNKKYKYVWTIKGEEKAKEYGAEERKAGDQAMYGGEPVDFYEIKKGWLESGYIERIEA